MIFSTDEYGKGLQRDSYSFIDTKLMALFQMKKK